MIGIGRPDTGGMESSGPDPQPPRGPVGQYATSEQLGFVVGVTDAAAGNVVFLVPQGAAFNVTNTEVFNRDSGDQTLTFRVIPPGEVTSDVSFDFFEYVVPAREAIPPSILLGEKAYPQGWQLVAVASAPDVINVRVHGMNLVQQ